MIRMMFAAALLLATGFAAEAQEQGSGAGANAGGSGGAGARSGNITSSGQTTPMPGASKGAGTTSLDRGAQKKDDEIEGSICKGC